MAFEKALRILREKHKQDHPNCTYGDQPHFVPPSFGDRGFYLCEAIEAKPSADRGSEEGGEQ